MSTAAPASPATAPSASSSRRPPSYTAESTKQSAPASPLPIRTSSHSRQSSQQAQLAHVASQDYEQPNLPAQSSPRSGAPIDRQNQESTTQYDSKRESRPPAERSTHSRQPSGTSQTVGGSRTGTNGTSQDPSQNARSASHQQSRGAPRRRTSVEAQTGVWTLGKTIGAGSMGRVKLARNVETDEQVAIKIVPRHSTDEHRNAQDRERADRSKEVRTAREAAIVTLVNHPYICGMRDVVRTNYHWYMLFEYVNGGQMLDYIISHGRLKEKQARKFARQIASALDYCHRNSIVHRDLKIENILISKSGDIKIIDFGLSNLFSPRSQLKTFCGSLYFAAPELLQAKQYTGPEVDIWSFGIVLYVLVCGKVPFDDQSMPQLHAKIKKGYVDYPPWLSTECKHLISRMLVTDPRSRATLSEIMHHPWITKGFNGPPDNFLPTREPITLPLDPKVIDKMTGFDFGSPEYITGQLTSIIESEDYLRAVRQHARKAHPHAETDRKRSGVFDFYQRRKSSSSRDTLTNTSTDAIALGEDPVNAFSPLVSIYYLVREKQDRERAESNPGALAMPQSPGQKPLAMPDLPAPEAAYTNPSAYEMAGEGTAGARTRPRARTHGEDEVQEALQVSGRPRDSAPPSSYRPQAAESTPTKREGAIGLLRRFSTRKGKDQDRDRERIRDREKVPTIQPPPSVAISGPEGASESARKSFSVGRTRDGPPSTYASTASNHPELLAPPGSGDGPSRRFKGLGRSTSVNSGDLRRRLSRRGVSEPADAKAISASEKSSASELPGRGPGSDYGDHRETVRAPASRALSMGGSRRESMHGRRPTGNQLLDAEVPEETDQELAAETQREKENEDPEPMKPVHLKGLFSVSTTSSKPLSFIRSDIIRVLKQIGVDYREMKGGFSCKHVPSIDIGQLTDGTAGASATANPNTPSHRRKISFGGRAEREREQFAQQQVQSPTTPRAGGRHFVTDSDENSEESEEEGPRRELRPEPRAGARERAAGETTTQVQSDMGTAKMVLKFEILVVKVPFLHLYGLQFKKVDGGTWQYKKMAETILNELKL